MNEQLRENLAQADGQRAGYMSCPRQCGEDVRVHASTDRLRGGGCDTAAARTAEQFTQIKTWMHRHGLDAYLTLNAEDIIGAVQDDRAAARRMHVRREVDAIAYSATLARTEPA